MNSLRFHVLATLGALVAACAIATSPVAVAGAGAVNNHGTYFEHADFQPIHLGH